MMAQVVCRKCRSGTPLRGWVEKEDLIGTEYEHLMDSITEQELYKLESEGKIMDQFDRWKAEGRLCPDCGSKDTYWY